MSSHSFSNQNYMCKCMCLLLFLYHGGACMYYLYLHFFNVLRRLPQLFAKDIALIQRLFQALCQVGVTPITAR